MKRALDLSIALFATLALVPLIILLALLVGVFLGRPVIFEQKRPGREGLPFKMFKFRTMNDNRGPDGDLLPDNQRLTKFGLFLRSTSLDELPELWNVIKGDMSLVGPRPLLMEYLPLYSKREKARHQVRPGITGWAQVNGRNSLSWSKRLEMDVWYVENRTLWLDVRILFMTLVKVVKREGISEPGSETMTRLDRHRRWNQ